MRVFFMKVATLRTSREFSAAFKAGRGAGCALFSVRAYALEGCPSKIGIMVSRKIGKAVVRNKVRRRIKEIWRELLPDFGSSSRFGVVIIAKPPIAAATFADIRREMVAALKRLRVL